MWLQLTDLDGHPVAVNMASVAYMQKFAIAAKTGKAMDLTRLVFGFGFAAAPDGSGNVQKSVREFDFCVREGLADILAKLDMSEA